MITVARSRGRDRNGFCALAEPFLQSEGLPFSDVLNAEWIQRVFREESALFGQDDIFSAQIVLWAFLAQTLRDGKGAACARFFVQPAGPGQPTVTHMQMQFRVGLQQRDRHFSELSPGSSKLVPYT